ncbi:Epoxide hydrolase 4 [Hypsibius exemplaris]|uniref:Epoxide hydrolase 4 n=1 Tax=Hypsibius exemplaris TaxID=2072580 RepID=A0A1W0W9R3_HYPEX|nr:Epoxide hydrolase 4 [Hypsibius exemplaris]
MANCGCSLDLVAILKNLPEFIIVHSLGIFWAVVVATRMLFAKLTGNEPPAIPTKVRKAPAVLTNPALGEHGFLNLKSGIKIHYVATGQEDKPLMLFLHGFPEFWYSWRHQLSYFKKNYRAVAIDMRGYGDSDKPSSKYAYSIPTLVEDIRQVVEALDRKSCYLVCHDWGAIVGWHFATVHPKMVDRLVILNCPHPEAFQKYIRTSFTQFMKSWYIFLFQLPYLAELTFGKNDLARLTASFTKPPMGAKAGTFSAEDIEAYKYTFGKPGALTPPVNYYRNIFRLIPVKRLCSTHLQMPVLLVFGTADQALDTEAAVMSGDWVDGYFEVKLLEGISHWVQNEAPDRVNEAIETFLSKDIPAHHKAHWDDK